MIKFFRHIRKSLLIKNQPFILFFLLLSCYGFAQETNFINYSYTEFFELIEKEQDSVFELNDAVIRYNAETDSLFTGERDGVSGYIWANRKEPLIVDKEIKLKNVHFITKKTSGRQVLNGIIGNVWFKKKVTILSTQSAEFYNCIFEERFTNSAREDIAKSFPIELELNVENQFILINCILKKSATVSYMLMDHEDVANIRVGFAKCDIHLNDEGLKSHESSFAMFGRNLTQMYLYENTFHGDGSIHFRAIENIFQNVNENQFNDTFVDIYLSGGQGFNRFTIEDNTFNKATFLEIDDINREYAIPINQFGGGLFASKTYGRFLDERYSEAWNPNIINDSIIALFKQSIIEDIKVFDEELSFKGQLHAFYKSKFNNRHANQIYVETKNLETERSKYLYKQDPSFKTFFTWKINQFLKVFSAYGTEPSRAIIFSMYVILIFALIYLFFPNSWDKHGKNRIVNRYNFFFKYMKRKAGIHEVYLEEQKDELMSYEQFKNSIADSKQKVPKFFTATALPLYKWAISGTKLSATFLKRIDIMKGSWSELPQGKRVWKSILLVGAFLVAILYDIIIKMLNALMLSINTFTTLGFGEIPIKGLPRYLAIIQGFIGWFMLTIFSVSLISQLLN